MNTSTETTAKARAPHLGPERRRPFVLDAALEIAVASGIGAVTIGAVADHMNVTRPVVYKCYGDRIELIQALLQREGTLLLDGLLHAMHSAAGKEPEDAWVTGFISLLRFVESRPGSWRLLFSADPDPALATRFTMARQALAYHATGWIRPALEAWWGTPDLDKKMPMLIEFFMSSCEAAAKTLLDSESTWTPEELGALYGRMICRAFEAA
ncbi:MAG: TetR/AcrR family transcriptional regulator [Nocardiaceae bacterium]|nr:TetR/AcrR family transcriptional regulator [Nocardiaceae bacterium]